MITPSLTLRWDLPSQRFAYWDYRAESRELVHRRSGARIALEDVVYTHAGPDGFRLGPVSLTITRGEILFSFTQVQAEPAGDDVAETIQFRALK